MAALVRQPFAPLDGTRLQSLTSMKNAQNSIPVSSPNKRKATELLDVTDFENVDPAALFKRAKSSPDSLGKDFFKPPTFVLTKSSSTPIISGTKDGRSTSCMYSSPLKAASPRPRSILNPKSPAKKLKSTLSKTPLSAPAGRSPTRGTKRIGILNRHRAGRIDPPSSNLFSAPFSLDAALKSTLPSYAGRSASAKVTSSSSDGLYDSSLKSSWFFDIHEDTPEQEMTNLLQHSTCMLDISSDEECEQKLRREKAEGRGKENIPPADDMSQTSTRRSTTISDGGMEYEKPRIALGDLNAEDFYAEGVDPTEVVIIPGDEDDGTLVDGEQSQQAQQDGPGVTDYAKLNLDHQGNADELSAPEPPSMTVKATLIPVEGTGESFELWESSSAKEEGDEAPSPVPASPASDFGES